MYGTCQYNGFEFSQQIYMITHQKKGLHFITDMNRQTNNMINILILPGWGFKYNIARTLYTVLRGS